MTDGPLFLAHAKDCSHRGPPTGGRLMERESSDVVTAAEAWSPRQSLSAQILKPPNRIRRAIESCEPSVRLGHPQPKRRIAKLSFGRLAENTSSRVDM